MKILRRFSNLRRHWCFPSMLCGTPCVPRRPRRVVRSCCLLMNSPDILYREGFVELAGSPLGGTLDRAIARASSWLWSTIVQKKKSKEYFQMNQSITKRYVYDKRTNNPKKFRCQFFYFFWVLFSKKCVDLQSKLLLSFL